MLPCLVVEPAGTNWFLPWHLVVITRLTKAYMSISVTGNNDGEVPNYGRDIFNIPNPTSCAIALFDVTYEWMRNCRSGNN